MTKKGRYLILITVFGTSLIGCVPLIKNSPERMGKEYLKRGEDFEYKDDLYKSLKQYKLAMTVNPSNQDAVEGLKRVEMEIHTRAEQHYRAGIKYYSEGKYGYAHHQFLIALRYRPDYPEVIKMLTARKRIQIKRYIVHTIKPGETLSQVAVTYYGDYQKLPIIAKYNNILDATRIQPGQEIKVPEIVGEEFRADREPIKTEERGVSYSGYREWEAYTQETGHASTPKEDETEDQVANYLHDGIDLFGKKQYEEALVAFNQVLKADPRDKVAHEYLYRSHFENAMALFERGDYLKARDEFHASLRYKSDCEECNEYVKRSEDSYKEEHYLRGIQYFGEEQLNAAIEEWEMVRAIDPNYRRAVYLIQKTETILKNIEKLKESLSEE